MCKKLALLLIFISNYTYGDNGYIYEGDLNSDGILDKISSGPSRLFGNAGGPFMISLSSKNGTSKIKVLGLHPEAIALEQTPNGNYLWGYWRYGSTAGSLFYISLDGQFKTETFKIRTGSESNLGTSIYHTIFDEKNKVELKKIENYSPPEYLWGK